MWYLGRGRVVHFGPAQLPTIFYYSLMSGMHRQGIFRI